MASSFILLADLKAGRCSTTAKSMFDALALAFLNKFESYGSEPRIVLATTINPKRGRLYLNSTSETHIYFDSETAVGKEMLDKLLMAQKIQRRRQKIEPLTVSELNEYVITADPQIFSLGIFTVKIGGADVPQAKLPEVDTQRSAVAPTKQQLGPEENEPKKERFE
ncbi:hypothetical protein Bca52824_087180 [Brassica carinata]|uniref:Uncharacterized protein n=1 Tax=Brassica carinata TaxID=52824 RepID=A0A8X7PAU6_BRACI|nr:hypothetical protein Bca52824_087180 [Brassica carinata]